MQKRALVAAAMLCLVAAGAEARPRHHSRHHYARHDVAPGVGDRPALCRGIPWCGCWLRLKLGLADIRLNRAIEWARLGSPANDCRPGLIAVWPHHVGEVTACLGNGMIRMISGNDGNAVRDRVRPLGRAVLRDL